MAGKKKIPKEYKEHYEDEKKPMKGRWGDPEHLDKFRPPQKAKAKKEGVVSKIKGRVKKYKAEKAAVDTVFQEKWKQRDLKKKIAKKKKESQAKRDAKKK